MVSFRTKLTLDFLELFCIPIINIKRVVLNMIEKNVFLYRDIFTIVNKDYKSFLRKLYFFARYFDAEDRLKPALINSLKSFFNSRVLNSKLALFYFLQ